MRGRGNRRKMPQLGNEHGRSRVRRLVFWQRRWRKQQCAAARIEQDGGSERDFLRCAFFAACGKQAGNTELARLAELRNRPQQALGRLRRAERPPEPPTPPSPISPPSSLHPP